MSEFSDEDAKKTCRDFQNKIEKKLGESLPSTSTNASDSESLAPAQKRPRTQL